MNTSETMIRPTISRGIAVPNAPHKSRRDEAARVMAALEQFCDEQGVGEKIPTHTELMRWFGASERMVLGALGELQRRGRIVRRHGAGTFVARPAARREAVDEMPTQLRSIVVIVQPDHSFFDLCVDLLFEHAKIEGLDLAFRLITPNRDQDLLSKSDDAAGFIIFKYSNAPIARRLLEQGHRVVVVGTPPANAITDIPCVHGDQEQGGYLQAKHLIDLGHTRLAFLHPEGKVADLARWAGVQRAIAEAQFRGKTISMKVIVLNDLHGGIAGYFSSPGAPTGVVAWNDDEAMKFSAAAIDAGLDIPGDISIIGYDDLPEGAQMQPALTTVDSYVHQQLDAAVRLLTRPTPPPTSHTVVALPALVLRNSTSKPKNAIATEGR
jgi:DNA-binding LacI/PurR family transcriptional regulator